MPNTARDIRVAKLKAAAEERKQDTLERAEKAIRKLLFANKRVTFPDVAEEAGVSVSYLYKYPELKKRIQQLRREQEERGTNKVKPPPPSDKSKDVMIKHLRERIKELEAEQEKQKQHISALSGQLYDLMGQREIAERLRQENQRLSERIRVSETVAACGKERTSPPPADDISPIIREELSKLEISLTASIQEKILSSSEARVTNAISVVKEALAAGRVRSKSRLFVKALEEGWEPGEDSSSLEKQRESREFSRWFELARSKGLVQVSKGTDKGIVVLTAEKKWVPYAALKLKAGWSLEDLQGN